jgi:hypothetical protein
LAALWPLRNVPPLTRHIAEALPQQGAYDRNLEHDSVAMQSKTGLFSGASRVILYLEPGSRSINE